MAKTITGIVFSRVIGFIIFLILLAILNALVPTVHNQLYSNIVQFFNISLILLLAMMLFGLINEIFWHLYFPFNILAPITSSALSILIIAFIYSFWNYLDSYVHTGLNIPIESIYTAVSLIVLIVGYLIILARGGKPQHATREDLDEWKQRKLERKREKIAKNIQNLDEKVTNSIRENRVGWDEVGNQFKLVFYNIGKGLNRMFGGKSEKSGNKKRKK
jgi:hypothetical protein